VQVDPKFHEDANKLEELAMFEEFIELHSSDSTVVKAPEYLLLTHNGRTFKLVSYIIPFHSQFMFSFSIGQNVMFIENF